MAQKKKGIITNGGIFSTEGRSDLGEKFGSENPKKIIWKSMAS